MVATEQHGEGDRRRKLRVDGIVHRAIPRHHLGQMAKAVDRRQSRIGRPREVAAVAHVVVELRDRRAIPATRRASGPMRAPGVPAPTSIGAPIRLTSCLLISSLHGSVRRTSSLPTFARAPRDHSAAATFAPHRSSASGPSGVGGNMQASRHSPGLIPLNAGKRVRRRSARCSRALRLPRLTASPRRPSSMSACA